METLTREQETAQAGVETPPEHVQEAPEPTTPCATCGAPMQRGQEWCLECGTARADRLAARPSWRSGGAVLAVTGVLVAGAVAAAWAGLSADSKRVASEGAQASVPPQQTQPAPPAAAQPPAATAAPPAAAAPPPAAVKPPKAASKATPPAAKAPAPTKAVPAAPSQSTAPPPPAAAKQPAKDTAPPQHSKPVAKLVAVNLADDAASTYNPYNRAGAESADPKLAVDGDRKTAWTANVDPSAGGRTAIGVDVDLGRATGVRALELRTPTPGLTVEIYGARTKDAPVSVQDPDWTHITTQLDVAGNGRIRLGDGGRDYRHILVWITEAPPDGQQVSLGELELYK